MAPLSQGQLWSEVLCCPICGELFSVSQAPINLICGHVVCTICISNGSEPCPHDNTPIQAEAITYPVNVALLSILSITPKDLDAHPPTPNYHELARFAPLTAANEHLTTIAQFLRLANSERGGAVYSDLISRTTQRRVLAVLFTPIYLSEGRIFALRAIRSLCERIVAELICVVQNTVHMSTFLWSAVRARGCQFLGPAMQEDVLRLILLTLANGELIARKTLVMYIVQTLTEDYPHVSKTCVGHVVQLLYRASCFNVIKRDGESSLMQLKDEFRDYDALRREHDSQIVQIALEAGLRVTPDQWSALLYGDPHHRSHMQSIVDRLNSPQLLSHALKELYTLAERNSCQTSLYNLIDHLNIIAETDCDVDPQWPLLINILASLGVALNEHAIITKRHCTANDYRARKSTKVKQVETPLPTYNNGFCRYKTKMCRDVVAGRPCPRRAACTYAHIYEELRSFENADNRSNDVHNNDVNMDRMMQNGNMDGRQTCHPPIMIAEHPMPPPDVMPIPMMPVHALGETVLDGQSVMIDNGNGYVNVVPVVMHPQVPDPEGYSQRVTTAVPAAVGMPTPVFMMPTVEPIPAGIQIANPHIPMVPAVVPGPHPAPGIYSYQIQSNHPSLIPHQPPVFFQQHNMWPPGQVYQKGPEVPFYVEQPTPKIKVPQSQGTSDSSKTNSSSRSATNSLSDQKSKWLSQEGSLLMRRNEVISRLRPFQVTRDDVEPEDAEKSDHVSFTVANSVLFDDVESFGMNVLDFPPLNLQTLTTAQSTTQQSVYTDALNAATSTSWSFLDSRNANNILSVRTVCPTTLMRINSTKPATVQADCTVMNVRDAIDQPLVTASIQSNNLEPQASYDMVDPMQLTYQLPRVMKPIAPLKDPQDFVSDSLDKIVTVQEMINEVPSSTSSAVEKEQLKVELNIANRQLSTLDMRTKQTCLLNELKAIDERIENLCVNSEH